MSSRLAALAALSFAASCAGVPGSGPVSVTHGPILGRLGAREIGVWGRTSRPAALRVRYGEDPARLDRLSAPAPTVPERDLTGWVYLTDLRPDTRYHYRLALESAGALEDGPGGTFRTLPDPALARDPEHNPRGLFNFAFEFACGNNQGVHSLGPGLPAFATMLRSGLPERIHFSILNGDWLYEDARETPVAEWLRQTGLRAEQAPAVPSLVGVWENYKLYLSRAPNLAEWHRRVPTFFTADDHEMLNDIVGTGTAGNRSRRAVFRDIGLKAWYDYLAWSNPVERPQEIRFGRARLRAGSDVLEDPAADFSDLDLVRASNLHVHWGTADARVDDAALDAKGGDPNAGVYDLVGVLGPRRLRIRPPARADGEASYSIGRRNWFRRRVSNGEFLFLDTRSHRDAPGRSMIGAAQKAWLKETMAASDADFFFVVSSVNLTIPHVGAGGMNVAAADKDDAWTSFPEEREELLRSWEALGRPVFVLTGDLHNSFAVRITDRVWEFAAGPHNSRNHPASSEGGRPASGPFDSRGRACEIRWSTWFHDATPRDRRIRPVYAVVQVNNVFPNEMAGGRTVSVAFPRPQVVFRYHDGFTDELLYAEAIPAAR